MNPTNYVEPKVKPGSACDLKIDKVNRTVTKSVSIQNEGINNGYTKLIAEAQHMVNSNNKGEYFYPKVYFLSEIDGNLVCIMEYLFSGINFADLLKNKVVSQDYIEKSLSFILRVLFKDFYYVQENIDPNPNYILHNYINRAKERFKLTLKFCESKNYMTLSDVIKNGMVLNGIYYPSYFKYLEVITNDSILLNKLSINYNTNSHHDLIPSNIMVECGDDCVSNFALIDPRGEAETGVFNRHFMYDMGKLFFGLSGFDLIRDMFDNDDRSIGYYNCQRYDDIYNIDFAFNTDNFIVKKYMSAYDSTLNFFKNSKFDYANCKRMFLFAETCNFVADIPCRLNNNDCEEIGICFYLRAVETMSNFIEHEYGTKREEDIYE